MRRVSTFIAMLLLAATLLSCAGKTPRTFYVKDYLTDEMLQTDAYPAIRAAIEACVEAGGGTIVLPGGTLPVKRDFCFERYAYVSNNEHGLFRIAFDFEGLENLTVEGNGTRLLFTGFISPFYFNNCRNVLVKDLSIDYTRPFNAQGTIIATGKGWVEVKFPDDYIIALRNGMLTFKDEEGTIYPYKSLLEFDARKREVAYGGRDFWNYGLRAEPCANGSYRVYVDDEVKVTVGNELVFGPTHRKCCGFTLDYCEGFELRDVELNHCGGMGIIAQRSKDIALNRFVITPTPGTNRVVSATADATHFVNCGGYIRMTDCCFSNQMDDHTDIHGWYAMVREQTSPRSAVVWVLYGIDFATPGMKMEVVNHVTMNTCGYVTVKEVKKYNNQLSEITFEEPLPEGLQVGDGFGCAKQDPEVHIKGCRFQNNRARGLLIGTRGKTVIEDCYFHTPGSALLFEGDLMHCYEQSGVRDVTIRNNVFENCLYGNESWGTAYINMNCAATDRANTRYHKNVVVENNTFRTSDPRLVDIFCVDGFVFRNNRVEQTSAYPFTLTDYEEFRVADCDHVVIE